MSRRLAEMAEETIDTGSKSDRALMQDVGFSGELKKQLEERIAQMAFNAQNQRALSEANMPVGSGTRGNEVAVADGRLELRREGQQRSSCCYAVDRRRVNGGFRAEDARRQSQETPHAFRGSEDRLKGQFAPCTEKEHIRGRSTGKCKG